MGFSYCVSNYLNLIVLFTYSIIASIVSNISQNEHNAQHFGAQLDTKHTHIPIAL